MKKYHFKIILSIIILIIIAAMIIIAYKRITQSTSQDEESRVESYKTKEKYQFSDFLSKADFGEKTSMMINSYSISSESDIYSASLLDDTSYFYDEKTTTEILNILNGYEYSASRYDYDPSDIKSLAGMYFNNSNDLVLMVKFYYIGVENNICMNLYLQTSSGNDVSGNSFYEEKYLKTFLVDSRVLKQMKEYLETQSQSMTLTLAKNIISENSGQMQLYKFLNAHHEELPAITNKEGITYCVAKEELQDDDGYLQISYFILRGDEGREYIFDVSWYDADDKLQECLYDDWERLEKEF